MLQVFGREGPPRTVTAAHRGVLGGRGTPSNSYSCTQRRPEGEREVEGPPRTVTAAHRGVLRGGGGEGRNPGDASKIDPQILQLSLTKIDGKKNVFYVVSY